MRQKALAGAVCARWPRGLCAWLESGQRAFPGGCRTCDKLSTQASPVFFRRESADFPGGPAEDSCVWTGDKLRDLQPTPGCGRFSPAAARAAGTNGGGTGTPSVGSASTRQSRR